MSDLGGGGYVGPKGQLSAFCGIRKEEILSAGGDMLVFGSEKTKISPALAELLQKEWNALDRDRQEVFCSLLKDEWHQRGFFAYRR